jgi:hypothetical protein
MVVRDIKHMRNAVKIELGLWMPAPEEQQAQAMSRKIIFPQKRDQIVVRHAHTLTIHNHIVSPFLPLFTTMSHYLHFSPHLSIVF